MPPRLIRILQSRTMAILGLIFILTGLKWGSMLFIVRQYEDAIVTRFGKAIRTETTPGLKLKLPFFDKVNRFDKRVLAWDGPPTECPTKDKLYLIVDCFAPLRDTEVEKSGTVLPSKLPDIQLGRGEIEKQITERTRQKIADFGIELLDERFKRSKYNPAVAEKIIERMSSERHQIAARFRSEGRGEAANINGQKESDVASISSTATKNALEIEGKADAEAAAIYAAAFGTPDQQELYTFLRSLDVMRAAFEKDTTAVLSTNSDLGRMLKSMAEAVAPKNPPH